MFKNTYRSQVVRANSYLIVTERIKQYYEQKTDLPEKTADLFMSNLWSEMYSLTSLPEKEAMRYLKELKEKGLFPCKRPPECTLKKSYQTTRTDIVGKIYDLIYTHMNTRVGYLLMRAWKKIEKVKAAMKKTDVKNVLIMADYRTKNSGNFIASLAELAGQIKENGGSVVYIAPYTGGYPWVDWLQRSGVIVLYFDENRDAGIVLDDLLQIIEKYNIDLIHSHFGYLHKTLIKFHRELNVKIIFHDHMDYSYGSSVLRQQVKQCLYAILYRLKGIGVISVMAKKSNGYWICGKKHWHVPNGLSMRRNVNHSLTRDECRERLGIKQNEKLCLFLGWDIMRKGLDVAWKAVERCNCADSDIVLGIVGFGDKPSAEQMSKLKAVTGVDPNLSNIRFLKSTEDMFVYHRAADVYLSASRFEAFSYGLLEAVSQNVPVVVSDIDGTRWAWKYTKCIVFENENAESCAEAIRKAIDLRWGDSNREDILEEYSIDRWCSRIMEIYKQM